MKTLLLVIASVPLLGGKMYAQNSNPVPSQSVQPIGGVGSPSAANANGGGGNNLNLENQFEDFSHVLGPKWSGATFGAGGWGDFNGDGWPDLWQSNHAKSPSVLQNNGDGTFTDVSAIVLNNPVRADAHGLAWADFDSDGDLDLIELAGAESGFGTGPNQLWRNDGGIFTEIAIDVGLDYPTGRGRTPLWLDWNSDGRVDLLTTNFLSGFSENKLFTQQDDGSFLEEGIASGYIPSERSSYFAQLADYDNDGVLDVQIEGLVYPGNIFSYDSSGWSNITSSLGIIEFDNVVDTAPGDFDGDLITDFYLARDPFWRLSQVDLDNKGSLRTLLLSDGNEIGFTFECRGPIKVSLEANADFQNYLLGSDRNNPSSNNFILSHKDDISGGIYPRLPTDAGVFIGREPDSDTWKLTLYSPSRVRLPLVIQSKEPITNISRFGFGNWRAAGSDQVLMHSAKEWTSTPIWASQFRGSSVVTGDFDNDMDLDLYVVRTGPAVNLWNKLFENIGGGDFEVVTTGGGASGVTTGVGDSVSMVDYDQDGFLDLFVTNGRSGSLLSQNGHHQLFHNTGNSNHWLEIDLIDANTNFQGVGAKVYATTPDGVVQLREQGGGMHRATQNHMRLHFGLGANTEVDLLEIHWPSGFVQQLTDIPADQILSVEE